jgi:hypothetical protein
LCDQGGFLDKNIIFHWCHHFGVAIRGGYELVVHVIRVALDVHLDWVELQVDIANAFNTISHRVIFLKLCAIGGQLF